MMSGRWEIPIPLTRRRRRLAGGYTDPWKLYFWLGMTDGFRLAPFQLWISPLANGTIELSCDLGFFGLSVGASNW